MDCLYCGKKINVLRKLQNEEFCSAAHRKAYNKKQEDLAVDFLRQSKPRPHGSTAAEPPPEPPPVQRPVPPPVRQPIPALAEFMAEGVTPQLTAATAPRHDAKPAAPQSRACLPAKRRVTAPGLSAASITPVALEADVAPGRVVSAGATPVAFPGEKPRLWPWVARPVWMEPPGETPGERPSAGFITSWPAEATAERKLARFSPAPRFPSQPPGISADLPPNDPAFQLARASPSPALTSRPVSAPQPSGTWRLAPQMLNIPRAAVARSASVLPASALPRDPATHAQPSPAARHASIERDAARPQSFPTIPPLNLAMDAPLLRSAPRAAPAQSPIAPSTALVSKPMALAREFEEWRLKIPLLSRDTGAASLRTAPKAATAAPSTVVAGAPKAADPAALTWQFQISTGPYARVGAVGPAFDTSVREIPIPRFEPRPPGPLKRLAGIWGAMPLGGRRLAVVVALVALAVGLAGRVSKSAWMQGAQRAMMMRIRQRAAIDIQDDFRSGLSQWTGAPGWDSTWSYDRAGFARPGRLALLAGSVPLADYRLEFLAQIDKKAVAWVFRAADTRNYYAMKLVESRAGLGAVYSLVRYAVIGGRERLRIQLPLPVAATAKTMFRVRQEIRGAEFTTSIDGQIVDTWSDASLARGGVGFFADPGESAYIRWVDVARNDDALGRLCAYLTAGKHD
jgi:hypothetical protein